MLSLWPDLFNLAPVAPVILRLALGGTFIFYGLREVIRPHYLSGFSAHLIGTWDTLLGILLIIGFFTQGVAVLVLLELFGYLLVRLKNKEKLPIPIDYILVMMVISLTLILLGAGLWAVDLPL